MKKIALIIAVVFINFSGAYAQFWINSDGEARLWTNKMTEWSNTMITIANHANQKSYVVSLGAELTPHNFYVLGSGAVWTNGGYFTHDPPTGKAGVNSIQNALSKVMNLNGIIYLQNKELGLNAQNVKQEVPEAVASDEKGDLGISYNALVVLLIEAVKEQQTQIKTMQALIYSQEQDLVELNNMLSNGNANLKSDETGEKVGVAELFQNVPNPFTSETVISFNIPDDAISKRLIIHDMQGVEIKSFAINETGVGSITLNGSELHAGMYLYTLSIDNKIIDTKRMLLTKD